MSKLSMTFQKCTHVPQRDNLKLSELTLSRLSCYDCYDNCSSLNTNLVIIAVFSKKRFFANTLITRAVSVTITFLGIQICASIVGAEYPRDYRDEL